MKGIPGLLVALALAVAGGLCNWFYMVQKARDLDIVQFIGVNGGIKAGETFRDDHLQPVPVPQRFAIRLKDAALPFSDRATVVGSKAYRDFQDGEMLLRQDLLTPPGTDLKRDLGANEEAIWVTVDSRGFVPSYFAGGDEVSFIVARPGATPLPEGSTAPPRTTDVVGPFTILALGNRRGSSERARAQGYAVAQENIVAVRVTRVNKDSYEPKAQELLDRLRLSNNQALGLVLHSDKKAKDK